MAGRDDDTDGLLVKIPLSLLQKQEDRSKGAEKVSKDLDFFRRTNIFPIQVTRNSEYGTTEVKSLGFSQPDQRSKILNLLDVPRLYKKLPMLLEYIYQLGCESNSEKRYYAGLAISELATRQPFADLKEAVILPWAGDENPAIRNTAAVALSQLIKQDRCKAEVLTLLKHWVSIGNEFLTNSALATFYRIPDSHPDEIFESIGSILRSDWLVHYLAIFDLFMAVYDCLPHPAIDQIHKWLLPVTDSDSCWLASQLSLGCIELDDAIEDEAIRKKVADIIYALWDDPRMPLHQTTQEWTTIMMETWAGEAVDMMNKNSSTENYRAFFHELAGRYRGKRNRLEFYLPRWEKSRERARERERLRASRRGEVISVASGEKYGYRHLLPQAETQ